MTGPDEVTKAIFRAARGGDTEELLELIGDSPERHHTDTPFGTPLHIAASDGNLRMVEALISRGANVNAYGGTFGGGPLNVAASGGHIQIMKVLLAHGALLDVTEPERNPLFSAIHNRHFEAVDLLLDAGIDASVRYTGNSMKNMSAADFAVERGEVEIAEYLKQHLARRAQRSAQTDNSASGGAAD